MNIAMDTLVTAATDRLADLEQTLHALSQIRGRYTSPDGLVTAQVDGSGALAELHLDERITSMPAHDVGRAITAACAEAATRAAEQRSEALARLTAAFAHHATR